MTTVPVSRNVTTQSFMRRLHLQIEEAWTPAPEWARFLVSLGLGIGSAPGQQPLVAAVALPTRSLAATLTLLGSSVASAAQFCPPDPQERFNWLASLPVGTAVAIHDPQSGTKQRGILQGCDNKAEIPIIRIRVSDSRRGNRVRGLPAGLVSRIEVLTDNGSYQSQYGSRRTIPVAPLLLSCMDAVSGYWYTNTTAVETIVLGRKGVTHSDVLETPIAIDDGNGNLVEGCPQDFVRLRINDRSAYRSHVISPGFRKQSMYSRIVRPKLVVFDGASGFLRSRHHWRNAHWIILLDRTEWQFEEAVKEINEIYIQRREGYIPRIRGLPNPPGGTELMLFSR